MRILIDPGRCTGHGRCYSLVPDLFDSDDEGHGEVLGDRLDPDHLAMAEMAVLNCPEQAISVVE
jgi:ferredoxin